MNKIINNLQLKYYIHDPNNILSEEEILKFKKIFLNKDFKTFTELRESEKYEKCAGLDRDDKNVYHLYQIMPWFGYLYYEDKCIGNIDLTSKDGFNLITHVYLYAREQVYELFTNDNINLNCDIQYVIHDYNNHIETKDLIKGVVAIRDKDFNAYLELVSKYPNLYGYTKNDYTYMVEYFPGHANILYNNKCIGELFIISEEKDKDGNYHLINNNGMNFITSYKIDNSDYWSDKEIVRWEI